MLDHHQRLAHGHLADQFHRLIGLRAAHAGRWFIEQDHVSATGNRDANLQRTLLGVGEQTGLDVTALLEADLFENVIGARVGVLQIRQRLPERIFVAERVKHRAADVFKHRQVGKNIGDLKTAGKAAAVDLEGL